MMKRMLCPAIAAAACLPALAQGANLKATYLFGGDLNSQQGTAPPLAVTDPNHTNGFNNDTLYGGVHPVYNFIGTTDPAGQAGLTAITLGLINPESYSAELVFKFTDRTNAWRRILDVRSRQSDDGFYVDPSNHLDIFPVAGSTATFTTNVYHYVALTVSANIVSAYLDGVPQFITSSALMNLDQPGNPAQSLNLFLDNTVGGGIGEYSSGSISLLRIWDGALSAQEIQLKSINPFASSSPLPGDNNQDGKVDLGNDFNLFLQGYLGFGSGFTYGDYNGDGAIDVIDFRIFIDAYVANGGSAGDVSGLIASSPLFSASQRADLLSAVPEPTSMAMSVFAIGSLAIRRRGGFKDPRRG
jgi:hypothetical protein